VTPYQEGVWGEWSVSHDTTNYTTTLTNNSVGITYRIADETWVQSTWGSWTGSLVRPPEYTSGATPDVERQARLNAEFEHVRAQRAEQELRYQEQMEEDIARRAAADQRAKELLPLVLSPEELVIYNECGILVFTGSDGLKWQVETAGYEGNVSLLDPESEDVVVKYCAHPRMRVEGSRQRLPDADAWVAQILALKTDVEQFLATANIQWATAHYQEVRQRLLAEVAAA
jgi:hypothetical protein